MQHQFYGKRYNYVYETEPIRSSYDLDKRIEHPDEYVYLDLKSIENVLLREVDYLHTASNKSNRTVIDNVTCQIDRTEVEDGIVKYYTNYTESTKYPDDSEFEKAKEFVVQEATERKNNKDNVISLEDQFAEALSAKIHNLRERQTK